VVLTADLAAQRQILLLDKDAKQRGHYDKNERASEAEEHNSGRHFVVPINDRKGALRIPRVEV
ncbi:MAG: hypothetical protein ISQ06_08260, partial [Planctomycetaceae bacterium]|nr:hypothetical protein [Planctomycetaceae bacterium]